MAKHVKEIQLEDRGGVESDEDKDIYDISAQNRGVGTFLMKGATSIGSNIAGAFSHLGGYVAGVQDNPRTQPQEEVHIYVHLHCQ